VPRASPHLDVPARHRDEEELLGRYTLLIVNVAMVVLLMALVGYHWRLLQSRRILVACRTSCTAVRAGRRPAWGAVGGWWVPRQEISWSTARRAPGG
jgi:hypothetical protein